MGGYDEGGERWEVVHATGVRKGGSLWHGRGGVRGYKGYTQNRGSGFRGIAA